MFFSYKKVYFNCFVFTGGADASSSNEAVHLQQRLRSLSSELVTLRNRLHVQGENANSPASQQQQSLHTSHSTNNVVNAINACHNQTNVLPPTLPKNQIPIPPHIPNTAPHIASKCECLFYDSLLFGLCYDEEITRVISMCKFIAQL